MVSMVPTMMAPTSMSSAGVMATNAFVSSLALYLQTSHPSFQPFHAFREITKLFSDAFNLCRHPHLLATNGNKRGATSEQHSGGQGGRKIRKTLLPGLHDLNKCFSLFYSTMTKRFVG